MMQTAYATHMFTCPLLGDVDSDETLRARFTTLLMSDLKQPDWIVVYRLDATQTLIRLSACIRSEVICEHIALDYSCAETYPETRRQHKDTILWVYCGSSPVHPILQSSNHDRAAY